MKQARVLIAALCLVCGATVRAEDVGSEWERAFPTRSAPPQVHFVAGYRDGVGRMHQIEVWRESDFRLRRKTDAAIELYVEKSAPGEYEYRLIDRERKILFHADRTSLYRIGVFSDWAGLAHVLDVPRGKYRVTAGTRQPPASPREDCVWKRLEVMTPGSIPSEICWSSRWGLPLAIGTESEKDGWQSRFSIESLETFAPGPETFGVAHEGLLEIDVVPDAEVSD